MRVDLISQRQRTFRIYTNSSYANYIFRQFFWGEPFRIDINLITFLKLCRHGFMWDSIDLGLLEKSFIFVDSIRCIRAEYLLVHRVHRCSGIFLNPINTMADSLNFLSFLDSENECLEEKMNYLRTCALALLKWFNDEN